MNDLPIDTARLQRDLDTLATFTEPDMPGWTRRAFSPAFVSGRLWIEARMHEAGLATRYDAGGNLIGRAAGTHEGPALAIGSHSDTVPGGGRFDGPLGVLAGIAIAQALHDAGRALRHPLEIIDFLAEEPSVFGSCLGSRAMAGALAVPSEQRDWQGRDFAEALVAIGGRPDALPEAVRSPGELAAYLELHIEQGRVLEAADAPIGIVRGIVGIRRATLRFTGQPDHAGTTPMYLRRDGLAAAAATVLAAEQSARATNDAVATVGTLQVSPNQSNVVPGAVEMQVEARSLDWAVVEQIWQQITDAAVQAGDARGVTLEIANTRDTAPMHTPEWLRQIIAEACHGIAPSAPVLPSGAGHDASWMGRLAPAGMIFVRSKDGRSHCPEEFSAPDDIAAGVTALARTLLALDEQLEGFR